MKLKIQLQHPNAKAPTYGTDGAACFDLYAARLEAERLVTQPNNRDRTIHVVQIVATLKPQTTHVWEVAA